MKVKIVAPIFGFEDIDEVEFEEIDEFFSKIESGDLAFTLINPTKIREYSFDIPQYYKELLELDSNDKMSVYNIVILSSDIKESKINFAAPIVINMRRRLLAQITLDEAKYSSFGLTEPISDYL